MFKIKKQILDLKRNSIKKKSNNDSDYIYLNRNERIIKFSKKIKDEIKKDLKKIQISKYPSIDRFYNTLSKWLKISKDNIYITEGLDGAIRSSFFCFTDTKSEIIFLNPTFAMYEVYSKMFNIKYHKINYTSDYKIDFNKIYSKININTALIFLPLPNNPISGYFSKLKIIDLLNFCKKNQIILFIDEVYYPFSKSLFFKNIRQYENLIIARSFSKAFGLASIRLGYMIASSKLIKYVKNSRSGYETNELSVSVASTLINNRNEVKDYLNKIKDGANYLIKELNILKIDYHGGNNSNFIYINLKDSKKVKYIHNYLLKNKIIVRSGWEKPWDIGFSLSISSVFFMKKFIKFFKLALINYDKL